MTDNTSTPVPELDPTSWLAREQEFAKLCDSIHPENKATLFEALARAGITLIVVNFDGYGDSGQIEDITANSGDKAVDLPIVSLEVARAEWGSRDIARVTFSMKDAIEQLAYDFLRETHDGWENNEGAYGDFVFDVAERTITLNYNERIETSEYTQHFY
jgi:hypothetical protein